MTRVTIRIPTPLRENTGGAGEVSVEATTVRGALTALESTHRGATARVLDEMGELRSFVNVFVDSKSVRPGQGLETALQDGSVLAILPAVAGGAR